MNKKRFISGILIAAIIFGMCLLGGCYNNVDVKNGHQLIMQAVEKSLEEDIYYIQNIVIDENNNYTTQNTYLYCDYDYNGNLYKNEDGSYRNFKIKLIERFFDNTTKKEVGTDRIIGLSESSAKNGSPEHYAFYTNHIEDANKQDTKKEKIRQKMSVADFKATEEFNKFTLAERLKEISEWKNEDLDFNISNGAIEKKLKCTILRFKMTDEYLNNYRLANGKDSLFAGKYIYFEIAYDRVSNVVVYQENNTVSFMPIENESYKLMIVYMSPKYDIPKYDTAEYKDGSVF